MLGVFKWIFFTCSFNTWLFLRFEKVLHLIERIFVTFITFLTFMSGSLKRICCISTCIQFRIEEITIIVFKYFWLKRVIIHSILNLFLYCLFTNCRPFNLFTFLRNLIKWLICKRVILWTWLNAWFFKWVLYWGIISIRHIAKITSPERIIYWNFKLYWLVFFVLRLHFLSYCRISKKIFAIWSIIWIEVIEEVGLLSFFVLRCL